MQITHIDIYRFSIKMEPFAIATGTMYHAQNTFIRVHTDTGLYGVGECSAFPMIVGETQDTCLVLAKEFSKIWKGKNPLDISHRLQELDDFIAGNTTIKSAFDLALHDIASKHANMPLFEFLGGKKRPITTDITVGIGSSEEMAEKALNFVNNGARVLKIKLGKQAEDDIERIACIREKIGLSIPLRIDANQGWSFNDAATVLKGIEHQHIQFCEQPMRAYNDYMVPQLKQVSSIPIMADESCYNHYDAERLIREQACDLINIKFAKSGGIQEALQIHATAAEHHIACMIGGMLESRVALTAKIHFAYACPNVKFFDLDTCMIGHLEDPVINGVHFEGYDIDLPDLPGIGADVDETFLQKCEKWRV